MLSMRIFRSCVVGHECLFLNAELLNLCQKGDCVSDINNIYVGLTSTTLSRRLTMYLSDTVLMYLNIFSYWHYLQNYI